MPDTQIVHIEVVTNLTVLAPVSSDLEQVKNLVINDMDYNFEFNNGAVKIIDTEIADSDIITY